MRNILEEEVHIGIEWCGCLRKRKIVGKDCEKDRRKKKINDKSCT